MAGQLDTLFKNVAKQVVADLGDSFDTLLSYIRKGLSSYNTAKGKNVTTSDTSYSIKVPVEFVRSTEDLTW